MCLVSRARPVHEADNLAAVYEPIVETVWDPQYFRLKYFPRPVMGTALLYGINSLRP
jgi:hypothetical protein